MEKWISIFAATNSADNEESQHAVEAVNEAISSADLEFIDSAVAIMVSDTNEYAIRNAAAVFLSRALTANDQAELENQQKTFNCEENSILFQYLKDSVLSISLEDTGTLRASCVHILSLLLNIERSSFLDYIVRVFSLFDSDGEGPTVALHLLEEIVNNPCASQFVEDEAIKDVLIQAQTSLLAILALPFDAERCDERILASNVLIQSISKVNKLFDSMEAVERILESLPNSFQVSSSELFSNLHQLLYQLCVTYYSNIDSFMGKVFEYLDNSIKMDDIEYTESAINFWSELSHFELMQDSSSGEEYVCVEAFPDLFEYLVKFLISGLEGLNNLYRMTYGIIKNIIKLNQKVITPIIIDSINEHESDESAESVFVILHLMASLKTVKSNHENGKEVAAFLIQKFPYIDQKLRDENEPIRTSALFCLKEILSTNKGYLNDVAKKNDGDSNETPLLLLTDLLPFTEEANGIYLAYFANFLYVYFDTYSPHSSVNPLLIHCDDYINILLKIINTPAAMSSIKISGYLHTALATFVKNMPGSESKVKLLKLFSVLYESFIGSFSVESEQFFYQTVLCSGMHGIVEKIKIAQEFVDILPTFKRSLRINNALLFADAFPVYASIVKYNAIDDFDDFMSTIEFGLESGDYNVINKICIGVIGVANNKKEMFFPYIKPLFEHLSSTLESAPDQLLNQAIPMLINAVISLLHCAAESGNENKEIGTFVDESRSWFEDMLRMTSSIQIDVNFIDQIEYGCDLYNSIFSAFGEFALAYFPKLERSEQKAFVKSLYIPFIRKAFALKCYSLEECKAFVETQHAFYDVVDKNLTPLMCHNNIKKLMDDMEKKISDCRKEIEIVKVKWGL